MQEKKNVERIPQNTFGLILFALAQRFSIVN